MKWIRRMAVVVAMIVLALAGYAWFSNQQFEARIDGVRQALLDGDLGSPPGIDLPEIVRAYALRAGGTLGGPAVFHATHRATLATAQAGPTISIAADQWTSMTVSELVWRAHGSMMGMPVTVVDSFVGGEGFLEARVIGALQVASGAGPDFDKGELQRYLSELPVYPDAILNNGRLAWRQIDATTVEVTGQSRQGPASLRFMFDEDGDIIGMEAADRPMSVGRTTVPTAWRGTYDRFRQFGRYRVPSYGEVGWLLPEGLFTYWKGEITSYEPL
jgi:hypothetical protein